MKISTFKYILILLGIVAISNIHNFWRDSYEKIDVFIWADHKIYIENVVADLSNSVIYIIFFLLLIGQIQGKEKKCITYPFLVLAILDILDYFIVYNQSGPIKLFIFIILLIVSLRKIYR